MPLTPTLGSQKQVISKFKANLVYKMCSRTARLRRETLCKNNSNNGAITRQMGPKQYQKSHLANTKSFSYILSIQGLCWNNLSFKKLGHPTQTYMVPEAHTAFNLGMLYSIHAAFSGRHPIVWCLQLPVISTSMQALLSQLLTMTSQEKDPNRLSVLFLLTPVN